MSTTIDGEEYHVGYFELEEVALRSRDRVRSIEADISANAALIIDQQQRSQYVHDRIAATLTMQDDAPNTHTRGRTSIYRGVCWDDGKKRWVAQISINAKLYRIGQYDVEEAAALDVDKIYSQLPQLREEFKCLDDKFDRQQHWTKRKMEILKHDGNPHKRSRHKKNQAEAKEWEQEQDEDVDKDENDHESDDEYDEKPDAVGDGDREEDGGVRPLSQFKGIARNGRYGWKAQICIGKTLFYLRTHSGPGCDERAAEDYEAIFAHREEVAQLIKDVSDTNTRRSVVQEYWSKLVGCDPPRQDRGRGSKKKKRGGSVGTEA